MTGELRVETQDLRGKAGQIEGVSWPDPAAQVPLISPDALVISSRSITNLANNAEGLWRFQEFGRLEGLRLAESLRLVADAYDRVDANARQSIENGGTPVSPPEVPAPNALPAPPRPTPMPIPRGLTADDMVLVPDAQRALLAGDQAASLQAAAAMWEQNAASLSAEAQTFELSNADWEGAAADAAYGKFSEYRAWLLTMADSWHQLATEANRLAEAHFSALEKHTPIFEQYVALEAQYQQVAPTDANKAVEIALKMAELQEESEQVRREYALDGQTRQVEPQDPPQSATPAIPVTSNGDPRRRGGQPGQDGQGGQAGGAPSGGSGAPDAQGLAQTSAQGEPAATGGAPSSGGAPSGGAPSGGSPSGGAPSGGAPGGLPGGLPGGMGKGEPKFPTDPALRPAAHGGGGAGGGAGAGGGGGGGMPAMPMSAAVSAETVAPAPTTGAAAGTTSSGAQSGGASGAMMGGMGGMAPMAGAHGAGDSREKKRNPAVAQDEDIYTEDRPWTEAVVGNRRRRAVQEGKESQ